MSSGGPPKHSMSIYLLPLDDNSLENKISLFEWNIMR